jgi:DNA-binding transcriptional ArsR family regulator
MIESTLAQEVSLLEADLCFALADPNRILILYTLDDHPRNVNEIANELNLPQPTTSRHLKILRERGLVHPKRQGTSITYSLADRRLIQALDLLRSVLRERITRRANLMEGLDE